MKRNLYRLNILCPDATINAIHKLFPTVKIICKYTWPSEGYLIFHSRKARDWANKKFSDKYFMCFTCIPEVEK